MGFVLRVLLGVALVALVVWVRGIDEVRRAINLAGPGTIGLVALWHMLPVGLCGLGWRVLLTEAPKGALGLFISARWIRDAINQMLPFLPLGGEVMSARLITVRGVPGGQAAAITVVDVTAEVMSQALFSLIGVGCWLVRAEGGDLLGWAGAGAALSVPMLGGVLLAQRLGVVRLLERLADKVMPNAWKLNGTGGGVQDAIVALYGDRRRFALAVGLHLAGWLVSCGEAWLILWMVGHPIGVVEVVALESVIWAIRNAAFLVPAGLGVQEGAYVVVGAAIGLPAEAALAISLIKRGREILLGLPALLAWRLSVAR